MEIDGDLPEKKQAGSAGLVAGCSAGVLARTVRASCLMPPGSAQPVGALKSRRNAILPEKSESHPRMPPGEP